MADVSLPQSRGTGLVHYWYDFRARLHHWRLVLTYLSAPQAFKFVSFNDGRSDSTIVKPPRHGARTWIVHASGGKQTRVDSSVISDIFDKGEYGY